MTKPTVEAAGRGLAGSPSTRGRGPGAASNRSVPRTRVLAVPPVPPGREFGKGAEAERRSSSTTRSPPLSPPPTLSSVTSIRSQSSAPEEDEGIRRRPAADDEAPASPLDDMLPGGSRSTPSLPARDGARSGVWTGVEGGLRTLLADEGRERTCGGRAPRASFCACRASWRTTPPRDAEKKLAAGARVDRSSSPAVTGTGGLDDDPVEGGLILDAEVERGSGAASTSCSAIGSQRRTAEEIRRSKRCGVESRGRAARRATEAPADHPPPRRNERLETRSPAE